MSGYRAPPGADHPQAKLTDDDVRAIRVLRAQGAKRADLSKQFGVSERTVAAVVNRSRWGHVE
jgi:predicted DNA-binding protein (UPF0251 family)